MVGAQTWEVETAIAKLKLEPWNDDDENLCHYIWQIIIDRMFTYYLISS
jgi:hypothetical protein